MFGYLRRTSSTPAIFGTVRVLHIVIQIAIDQVMCSIVVSLYVEVGLSTFGPIVWNVVYHEDKTSPGPPFTLAKARSAYPTEWMARH